MNYIKHNENLSDPEALRRKISTLEEEIKFLKIKLGDQEKQNEILQHRLDLNDLSLTKPFNDFLTAVIDSAERLTGSKIGFFHFYDENKRELSLQAWSTNTISVYCAAQPGDQHYSLDIDGVWTDCIKQRKSLIHNDYNSLPHRKGLPEGHAQVLRMMTVPVMYEDSVVGILGVGNKETDYTDQDLEMLTKFSDIAWETIMNRKLIIKLEESVDRHRILLDTMFEGVTLNELVFDDNGEIIDYRVLEVNSSVGRLFPLDHVSIEGRLASEVYDMSPVEIRKFWEENYYNDKPVISEVYHNNTGRWIRVSTSPVKDNKFTTVFFDITDSRHSHDLMSYIIEHNRGAVAVHDREMRYIYVSQRYLTDYQVKEKNIIGKHHYDVFPDLPQKWRIAHQEALRGKIISKEEDIYEKDDGTIEWTRWECRPWYEADKTIGGIIVYTELITERKRIEVALKNSEMQLNALFNSAPVIMILMNEKTEVLRMNKFGLESTGRNIESLTGLKPGDVLRCVNSFENSEGCGYGKECQTCIIRKTIADTFLTGKEYYKTEAELTSRYTAEKHHTLLVSTSIISTTPEIQVLLTIDDITGRKELEKELIKARDKAEESDNLKSAFLANISHEIRTPMNGILGFSEMLSKPNLTDEKRNQFSSLIQDGCRQLLGVINDVIEISMIDTCQMVVSKTDFSLNEFLQDIFLMFRSSANSKNLNMFYKAPDRRLELNTDREKLKHVFSNLVSNAIKFTKQGHIEFGYTQRFNNVEFFVKDTGIGIRKELHTAVFERFRQAEISDTRNYNGTGLGLSISKGLVKLLGGEIWIESEPGKGTTFFFTIPETIVTTGRESTDLNHSAPVMIINEILIAEDDEINFLFMQEVLEEMNHVPIHACNGAEAVQLLMENPSVKLILMDIKMPVMDGYQATREIRKINNSIPIIAQTAFQFTGTRGDLIRSGFNDSISKPIDKSKLESLIRQYVR